MLVTGFDSLIHVLAACVCVPTMYDGNNQYQDVH